MKEIRAIVDAWKTIDLQETRAALVTVVRVEGSSYRRAGARMLVLEDGTYLGGISGGCLEGDALRRAQKGIALGRPSVITYDTTQDDDYQIGVGLGCQGVIDVLFTPLFPDDPGCPLRTLAGLTARREPVVVVTVTSSPLVGLIGKTCLYRDETSFRGCFPAELTAIMLTDIRQALAERASRSMVYGDTRVFIEVILPAIHIVAFGGNYDIRTLLNQAKELGWDSTVVLKTSRADRTLVAAATTVIDSKAATVVGDKAATVIDSKAATVIDDKSRAAIDGRGEAAFDDKGKIMIDDYTAVLLMSHDYRTDMENLKRVLGTSASYIGLLGPRKRATRIFDELAEAGRPLSEDELRRVYAPAGLDIGAATPEEIALSILAEVRGHFAGRDGASLRLRQGSIYG